MNEYNLPRDAVLYADSNLGVYIPKFFADSINRYSVLNVRFEDYTILSKGPDSEYYWDTWDAVLDKAIVLDHNGVVFTLYQDGDLWFIPKESSQ